MIGLRTLRQSGGAALYVLAVSLIMASDGAAGDAEDAWDPLVNGGHVVLIRHGNAPPGYGDPPGSRMDARAVGIGRDNFAVRHKALICFGITIIFDVDLGVASFIFSILRSCNFRLFI
jgi:hypothetical protein